MKVTRCLMTSWMDHHLSPPRDLLILTMHLGVLAPLIPSLVLSTLPNPVDLFLEFISTRTTEQNNNNKNKNSSISASSLLRRCFVLGYDLPVLTTHSDHGLSSLPWNSWFPCSSLPGDFSFLCIREHVWWWLFIAYIW